MLIRKAYKFKLKTTQEIEEKLTQFAGCCRFLWNKALALNLKRLEEKQPFLQENILNRFIHFASTKTSLPKHKKSYQAKSNIPTIGGNKKEKLQDCTERSETADTTIYIKSQEK